MDSDLKRGRGLGGPRPRLLTSRVHELAFHIHNGYATCPSVVGRNTATLLTTDLHPMVDAEIWSGNDIATSLNGKITITMNEDGCPAVEQPFPPPTKILHKSSPLWEQGIHEWGQILGRGPNGRSYFLDDRELPWANPTLQTNLPPLLRSSLA